MRTRKDELALEIFAHLDRSLSDETKAKLSSSDTREIVLTLSEYILIENFNTIFDHLHKFQTALLTKDDTEENQSDFMDELKKI
jgi:hypothetical protein